MIVMINQHFFNRELVRRMATGIALVIFLSLSYCITPLGLSLFFLALMMHLAIVEWPRIIVFCQRDLSKWLLLAYLVVPFMVLMVLNHSPQRALLVIIFGMVFMFDSASYAIGTLAGYHRLCPSVSPRKTWEGLLGGITCTLLTTGLYVYYFNTPLQRWLIPFVLMVCVLAFVGDLFQSFLKRKANLKDTGIIFPGHGGVFDRFDSILLVSYFFYFLREPLMQFLGLV